MTSDWNSNIREAPEGFVLETKIHDADGERNHANLIRKGSLFFLPDMSMYVYYRPTHWRAKHGGGE